MIANLIRKFYPSFESKKEMAERFTRTVQELQLKAAFNEGRAHYPIQVIQQRNDAFEIRYHHIIEDAPIEYTKESIVHGMIEQLRNVISWEVKDAENIAGKILIGRLFVYLKEAQLNADSNRRRV